MYTNMAAWLLSFESHRTEGHLSENHLLNLSVIGLPRKRNLREHVSSVWLNSKLLREVVSIVIIINIFPSCSSVKSAS